MSKAAQNRRIALSRELERVVSVLKQEDKPLFVYLFGSLARGSVDEWSDIDLVIVKETSKRFLDRIADVLDKVSPRVGMDIVVYTPEEWKALSTEPFVREEVLKRGRLLYAA